MKKETKIELAAADRQRLERLATAPSTPQKHVWRAQIVLLSADGAGTMEITRQVGVSKRTIWRWQDRYCQQGVEGLRHDRIRPGRLPPLAADTIRAVVEKTLQESPPDGATHWSTRSMARAVGLGRSSIDKIWTQHGLKPHRVKTFKVSRDPAFVDKVRDVVGLYVNPPEHTLVLSVDEKSPIQALERTQAPCR
jgi:transposase